MPKTATGHFDDDDDDVTECPECGAEVYAIADCCPKCGYWFIDDDRETAKARRQTAGERRLVKIGAAVLIAILVFGVVVAGIAALSGG
jgi:uncharacterized membrane protein YvbJ